jgi:isoquinoline 1-oxidoreductase beta subunit
MRIRLIFHGKGIAISYNQGSFVAEVAEVSVLKNRLEVLKIYAAVDCGIVINPSGARHQIEGAILEGLCAVLYGKIDIDNGRTIQGNFDDYRWIRYQESPGIEISLIDSIEDPRGLGEPPLPPVAPAVCNAIYAACGKRIRSLPLSEHFELPNN